MEVQNLFKNLYFSLLNVDDCHVSRGNYQNVVSPFTRLYLIKGGEGTIFHNGNKYELKPGRLYLIPSFTCCSYSSKTFLEHFYVHFMPQNIRGIDVFKLFKFKYETLTTETDFLLMKRILELNPGRKLTHWNPQKYSKEDLIPHNPTVLSEKQFAEEMETQSILLQFFSRFISKNSHFETESKLSSNSTIAQTINYIQNNITKTIKIKELAEICSLSSDYFSRLFMKTTGMRPIEYINRKRIENA